MAGSAKAPGCGEYNRKNALARQIYTIRRGGTPAQLPYFGVEGPAGAFEAKPPLRDPNSKTGLRSTAAWLAGNKKPTPPRAQFHLLQIPMQLRA